MKRKLEIHKIDVSSSLPIPYADEGIRAGFPSPAQDYMEQAIDLNKELIKHPASTFFGRVVGDSMRDEGIEEGDILVIDKSLELQDDDLAVCFIDGDFTVKRVRIEPNAVWLIPANPKYSLTGGVQDVDAVAVVLELHHGRGDGNASLLFNFHPVGHSVAGVAFALYHACQGDGTAVQQEFFRQSGFTGVRVGDDGKSPPALDLAFQIRQNKPSFLKWDSSMESCVVAGCYMGIPSLFVSWSET